MSGMANYSPNEEPFPGSAADFYEKNQLLSKQLETYASLLRAKDAEIGKLKSCILELADALGEEFGENYGLTESPITELLQRAREAVK